MFLPQERIMRLAHPRRLHDETNNETSPSYRPGYLERKILISCDILIRSKEILASNRAAWLIP